MNDGELNGDEVEYRPLAERMLEEARRVLEPDSAYLAQVEGSHRRGDLAATRKWLGEAYRAVLAEYGSEKRQAFMARLGDRYGVETEYQDAVLQESFREAVRAVERFEQCEGEYGGTNPVAATPTNRSFFSWFDSKLKGCARDHGTEMQEVREHHLKELGGEDEDELAANAVEVIPGNDDPEVLALARLAVDFLSRCRMAAGRLDLESPDVAPRRGGPTSDKERIRRCLASIVIRFFNELEAVVTFDRLDVPNVVVLVRDCMRDACREDRPSEEEDGRNQFVDRNELEGVFAVRACVQVAGVDHTLGVDELLTLVLQKRTVQLLTERLAKSITTDEVGPKRFTACLVWLDEVLSWLREESNIGVRDLHEVVATASAHLNDTNATTNGSPLQHAQRLLGTEHRRASDAADLIALDEHLRGLERGLRVELKGTGS